MVAAISFGIVVVLPVANMENDPRISELKPETLLWRDILAFSTLMSLQFCSPPAPAAYVPAWQFCMALNIYHEARGESLHGQMAVALVTLRRAQYNGDFICREVFRRSQFSWTLKEEALPLTDVVAWQQAMTIAERVWFTRDFTGKATHYHATHVTPSWAANMVYTGQWGNHYFYRRR